MGAGAGVSARASPDATCLGHQQPFGACRSSSPPAPPWSTALLALFFSQGSALDGLRSNRFSQRSAPASPSCRLPPWELRLERCSIGLVVLRNPLLGAGSARLPRRRAFSGALCNGRCRLLWLVLSRCALLPRRHLGITVFCAQSSFLGTRSSRLPRTRPSPGALWYGRLLLWGVFSGRGSCAAPALRASFWSRRRTQLPY